ncbi:hypothetical protein KM043_000213 [Ampulex compressa]|nr:hypothetical protein KM043_000213 [Ampulex compressa]
MSWVDVSLHTYGRFDDSFRRSTKSFERSTFGFAWRGILENLGAKAEKFEEDGLGDTIGSRAVRRAAIVVGPKEYRAIDVPINRPPSGKYFDPPSRMEIG